MIISILTYRKNLPLAFKCVFLFVCLFFSSYFLHLFILVFYILTGTAFKYLTYPTALPFTQYYFYSLLTCFELGSDLGLRFGDLFFFNSKLLLFLGLTHFIAPKITIVIGEVASFGL